MTADKINQEKMIELTKISIKIYQQIHTELGIFFNEKK